MKAFVIRFHGKMMLALHPVAHRPQRGDASAWRPFVWTRDIVKAEKFDSHLAASLFASALDPQPIFDIVELTPRPVEPVGAA